MSDEKQAVVDTTDAAAKPAATDDSARKDVDDLDALLAEFDQGTKRPSADSPPEPKPKETAPTIDPATIDRIKRVEDRLFKEDLDETVKQVFGDMQLPRRAAVGWLDQMARENPQVAQAWMNKTNDPHTWNRFAKSLAKEAAKDFPPPVDQPATADRELVAASMKGASTKVAAEPAPNLGRMSNAEYRKTVLEQHGFDPGV